ncbi:hypothetical protein CSE16_09530 [Solibacillus sp. R5-41]|uniref:hypothetical protein n=1 Tax=Solibacillus sp. R5-41 TaxID=2048654 RepID=UPI000C124DE0|nr:hypothetical protein [Solibacillus sp. R5-41]ATP40265.1 hypothetical protein CSE16_09530 [Solibacillus sp. R5-41]
MTNMTIMFIIFLYIVISAFVLWFFSLGNLQDWVFRCTLVLFLPVIGWFIPSLWPKKLLRNEGEQFEAYMNAQTDDIAIELRSSKLTIEKDRELAVVSIEEALIISDFTTRRRVMLDLLKQDAMKYLDILQTAVTNDDTETSHYAVTAVIEVKRELSLLLQKLSVEFSQNPQDQHVALTYVQVIREYLQSGFLDKQSTKNYRMTYIQVIQSIIENNKATEALFNEKIDMELTLGELQAAEQTALLFKEHYPLSEKPYLQLLAIYCELKSASKFRSVLNNLKNAPITLTNEALVTVRYWSTGVNITDEMAMD